MKRFLILMIVLLLPFSAFAESVTRKIITVDFFDTSREGYYTGNLNEDGKPDGFGVFEGVNDYGFKYYIIGDWVKGEMTGFSWEVFSTGLLKIGKFDNGKQIEGYYYTPSEMQVITE